jgi:SDR family mycofactocin-dependent oxidoreductase
MAAAPLGSERNIDLYSGFEQTHHLGEARPDERSNGMSLDGKVAFITGAARGQGRAHALRLARDGAKIIGTDICEDIASMDYPNATAADLAETVKMVESIGGAMIATKADVRNYAATKTAVDQGVERYGRLDIVIANAGIVRLGDEPDDVLALWNDIIDTNLTGVFHTVRATRQHLIDGGEGGSIVITSSSAGLKGTGTPKTGGLAYTAAKRGLVGMMQVLANDLAKHMIRVNTIHPTGVATGMTMNEAMMRMVAQADAALSAMQNALPIDILQPEDIANAVAWLVSDEAKFITGVALPLDAGFTVR